MGSLPRKRQELTEVCTDIMMQPKKRIPKHTSIVDVKEPRTGNNGDIIIIPRQVSRPLDDDRYEEMTVNRVRYQVPEETVILDFWGRITGYVR